LKGVGDVDAIVAHEGEVVVVRLERIAHDARAVPVPVPRPDELWRASADRAEYLMEFGAAVGNRGAMLTCGHAGAGSVSRYVRHSPPADGHPDAHERLGVRDADIMKADVERDRIHAIVDANTAAEEKEHAALGSVRSR
jgi:hypothetical protein